MEEVKWAFELISGALSNIQTTWQQHQEFQKAVLIIQDKLNEKIKVEAVPKAVPKKEEPK